MSSVDVVVPCYQYGRFLRQCVGSVLSQTGPAVRVLIIDDASDDETSEIARDLERQDSRVRFVRHRTNIGHIATYNEGLDWASAKYLLLLSADDYLLSGALNRSVKVLDSHPQAGFVFGNACLLRADASEEPTRLLGHLGAGMETCILSGEEFVRSCAEFNVVPTPTAVVRTCLQKEVGGYRPELPHTGDMEMWWRLAARAPVGFVRSCQAVYRRHSTNMSTEYMTVNRLPDLRQRQLVLDMFFGGVGESLAWARALRPEIYRDLARNAVGCASAAFNEREYRVSNELADFAVSLSPGIRRSWPWLKLGVKRSIGERASRILRSVLSHQTRA